MPRASRTEVGGSRGGALLVRVQAPPVGGAANEALAAALAAALRLRPADVLIERGARGRTKVVSVPAGAAARVKDLLGGG